MNLEESLKRETMPIFGNSFPCENWAWIWKLLVSLLGLGFSVKHLWYLWYQREISAYFLKLSHSYLQIALSTSIWGRMSCQILVVLQEAHSFPCFLKARLLFTEVIIRLAAALASCARHSSWLVISPLAGDNLRMTQNSFIPHLIPSSP